MKHICSFLIRNLAKKQCSYQGFLHWAPQDPRKLKGGHKGEKRVTVYEYIIQDGGASEWITSRLSMRRNCYFIDTADGVFSKDA